MTNKHEYPEISFTETNAERLTNTLIKSYEMFTGRTLYPADPTRLFILWVADIIIQERIIIDESAKQNIPRYAKGKSLDSVSEIFKDTYRLEAEPAKVTLKFTISTILETQQIVPKGTRVTVDGDIVFETTEELYIEAGQVDGEVLGVCQTVGEIGNNFIPGQINKIVDLFPYFKSVENTTTSSGGSEEEEDESFYERMRESMESFSTAGPTGAYIYHAKTASSKVADVSASSPSKGVADIRILLKDGELPSEEILNKVKESISADKTRPFTDHVTVSAPGTVDFNIDIKYFIPKPSANSGSIITQEVDRAITEYRKWQTEKMGRDINPSYLISLIMATGVKRVEVTSPNFTTIQENEVAKLITSNVINGGVEDE